MEWSFFVTEDALKRLQPNMGHDEASFLRAFDDHRNAIHAAAVRAFERERKRFYELGAADFCCVGSGALIAYHRERGLCELISQGHHEEHPKREEPKNVLPIDHVRRA